MARVNLLPWREELRQRKRTEYFVALGVCAAAALVAWLCVHLYYVDLIENQGKRNAFLSSEIKKLDKKISEIKRLEKEKENLIARMRAIESLQTSRPLIVYLFDDLVSTLPEGAYLTEVTQRGRTITVKGVAQSNARVSSYMRNIEQSERLKKPKLSIVETRSKGANRSATFTLSFEQTVPKADEDEQEEQL
jgi:type IV pilus assembly protein PilN